MAMTRDEIDALIEARILELAANAPQPSYPSAWTFHPRVRGAGISSFPPGTAPGPLYRACIVIVDDREAGTCGPESFPPQLEEVLQASRVVIDSAEPSHDVYERLMKEVASGNVALLVIQTTEHRHQLWREFLRVHRKGKRIAEVVPVKDDPQRTFRAFFTDFDRDGKAKL